MACSLIQSFALTLEDYPAFIKGRLIRTTKDPNPRIKVSDRINNSPSIQNKGFRLMRSVPDKLCHPQAKIVGPSRTSLEL